VAPCGYAGCAGWKDGESSTLCVAVIFYGLSRVMLERESALPAVQDVSEIFDVPLSLPPFPSRERGGMGARARARVRVCSPILRNPFAELDLHDPRGAWRKKRKKRKKETAISRIDFVCRTLRVHDLDRANFSSSPLVAARYLFVFLSFLVFLFSSFFPLLHEARH